MNKFKIGDRVKCINKKSRWFNHELIIIICDEEDNSYYCYNYDNNEHEWINEKELELISCCYNCIHYADILKNMGGCNKNKFTFISEKFCCRDFERKVEE